MRSLIPLNVPIFSKMLSISARSMVTSGWTNFLRQNTSPLFASAVGVPCTLAAVNSAIARLITDIQISPLSRLFGRVHARTVRFANISKYTTGPSMEVF